MRITLSTLEEVTTSTPSLSDQPQQEQDDHRGSERSVSVQSSVGNYVGDNFKTMLENLDSGAVEIRRTDRSCLMCLKEIPLICYDEGPYQEITLHRFCNSLGLEVPSHSESLIETFNTPLCNDCAKRVTAIEELKAKIMELQKLVNEEQASIRDTVLSVCLRGSLKILEDENALKEFVMLCKVQLGGEEDLQNPKSRAQSGSKRKRAKRTESPKTIHNAVLLTREETQETEKVPEEKQSTSINQQELLQPILHLKTEIKSESHHEMDTSCESDRDYVSTSKSNLRGKPTRKNQKNTNPVQRSSQKRKQSLHSSQGTKKIKKPNNRDETNNDKICKCNLCDKSFADEKRMKRHQVMKHKEDAVGEFFCKSCNKTFKTLGDLSKHREQNHFSKKHTIDDSGRKIFKCEYCGIDFKNQGDLLVHTRRHTGELPFQCSVCNTGFISKGRYEVHAEAAHPHLPPLKCQFCPKRFFRDHRLQKHSKTHTGEKPYLCEICSKSFSQATYLKYHQTVHKELNLSEYRCDQCDKTFASPVNLEIHKQTVHEKRYRHFCTECGHGTMQKSHLRLHMRSHTGERPHVCQYCNKGFTRGHLLKVHERTHTNERPYVCNICTKAFVSSSKLKRHEKTHRSKAKGSTNDQLRETFIISNIYSAEALQQQTDSSQVLSLVPAETVLGVPNKAEVDQHPQFLSLQETSIGGNDATYQIITADTDDINDIQQGNITIVWNGGFAIT